MDDYEFPDHVGRRAVASVVAVVAVSELMSFAARPWLPLGLFVLLEALGCSIAGWFAGKWAFRSKLSFRSSMSLIWREYRGERQ